MSDENILDTKFEGAEFEAKLTQAMQRVDAPEGFAARIMDRVAKPAEATATAAPTATTGKVIAFRSRVQRYAALGLAAMLALGVFGLDQMHQRHERAVATQQFETASRITDQALAHTRQQLARAGVSLDSLE
jgi:hypothetical protein